MSNPFEKVLGVTSELLVLEEILASSSRIDDTFTIDEIHEITEVPRKKIKKVLKSFIKWGIITESTKLDYKLNLTSPLVKAIQAFNNALVEEIIGEEACYKIHEYLEENIKEMQPVPL
jgi:predicted transcriptional regulator